MNDQQAAFEAWHKKEMWDGGYDELHASFDPDAYVIDERGRYENLRTQIAWRGYQAALASPEVQALRKDAERLDFITAPENAWFVQWEKRSGKPVRYRMIDDGEVFGKWHDTARQAIDAAMEKQK